MSPTYFTLKAKVGSIRLYNPILKGEEGLYNLIHKREERF